MAFVDFVVELCYNNLSIRHNVLLLRGAKMEKGLLKLEQGDLLCVDDGCIDNEFKGVYSGQYALPTGSEKIYYLTNDTLNNCKVFDYENNKAIDIYDMEKAYGKDPYEMFLSGPLSLVTIENDNAENNKELVVFRDSYGSALAQLMAEGYSKITLVDIRYMHPDMVGKYVDFKNADVLFIYSTSVLNNSETIK
jgi:hypothetical protein